MKRGERRKQYEFQGGTQSSKEVWINLDDDTNQQGTQTIDSDEDKPTAIATKKARRGKPRIRVGRQERALERVSRDLELREQTSPEEPPCVVETPASPTFPAEDEGSLSRSQWEP